jgi:hypothetical protein
VRRTLATLALVGLALGTSGCGGADSTSDPSATSTPDVTVLKLEPGVSAKCMMPSARILRGFTEAFSGTVTRVEGTEATLDVDRWYAGGDAPEVVVQTSRRPISEAGLFDLEKGKRYLISGTQGSVSLCGFSAAWSPDLERLYAQAFATKE